MLNIDQNIKDTLINYLLPHLLFKCTEFLLDDKPYITTNIHVLEQAARIGNIELTQYLLNEMEITPTPIALFCAIQSGNQSVVNCFNSHPIDIPVSEIPLFIRTAVLFNLPQTADILFNRLNQEQKAHILDGGLFIHAKSDEMLDFLINLHRANNAVIKDEYIQQLKDNNPKALERLTSSGLVAPQISSQATPPTAQHKRFE